MGIENSVTRIDRINTNMQRNLYKADKLLHACIGVAKGPTGMSKEQSHVKDYITKYADIVDANTPDFYNPTPEEINNTITHKVHLSLKESTKSLEELLKLPWGSNRTVKIDRAAGTIISFSDDHQNKIAREFFPIDQIVTFLNTIRTRYEQEGKKVNIIDQFDESMKLADNNPLSAALLAHSAYRSIARGWDTRVDEKLKFPVDSAEGNLDMIKLAESTALFNTTSQKIDPLGDTYHWWGQFTAGMLFELYKDEKPVQSAVLQRAFYYGPNIMSFVRENILGKKQIAGNHKEVDRHGLQLGRQVAQVMKEANKSHHIQLLIPQK